MKRFLIPGLFLISITALALLLFGNDKKNTAGFPSEALSSIEGLKIIHRENGNIIWTVRAQKADFRLDGNSPELSGIEMEVPGNNLLLHSGKGIYNISTGNFSTSGEVTAMGSTYSIKTTAIDYDAATGEMRTDGMVQVEGKKFRISGKGMKTEAGHRVKVLKNVQATFYR
jgi:LPS export ABC transporter protein LptC